MVALAAREVIATAYLEADIEALCLSDPNPNYSYEETDDECLDAKIPFPRDVVERIADYDAGYPVTPFSFDLEIPDWVTLKSDALTAQ